MKKMGALVILIVLICFGTACAETAYVNGITSDRVHLRSKPDRTSPSLGLFYTGTPVEADTLNNEWTSVQIGETKGYMMTRYLDPTFPSFNGRKAEIKTNTLNMRQLPDKGSRIIQVLTSADEIIALGHLANGFYYIQTDDLTGYVMEEYLNVSDETVSLSDGVDYVGRTFDGYHICSWTAPNGQTLYFSALEDPYIKFEDVNFDGHEDIVITIIRGASNFFTEFFVWENGRYIYAEHPGLEYAMCNYQLYPEYGLVFSGANNGGAGSEHENVLLRWEGTELNVIRRAVSDNASSMANLPSGNGYTITHDFENLRVRVWDYTSGQYEGELIYEDIINKQDLYNSSDYNRAFAGEQEAFWKGIK